MTDTKKNPYEPVEIPFSIDPCLLSDIAKAVTLYADSESGKVLRLEERSVYGLYATKWTNEQLYKVAKEFSEFGKKTWLLKKES